MTVHGNYDHVTQIAAKRSTNHAEKRRTAESHEFGLIVSMRLSDFARSETEHEAQKLMHSNQRPNGYAK